VFKRVLQQRGEGETLKAAVPVLEGTVVDLDAEPALAAAKVSLAEKLPMADSTIRATPRAFEATL